MDVRQYWEADPKETLRQIVATTIDEHGRWVDDGGFRSGSPGPLDALISELEASLAFARRVKLATVEEDNERLRLVALAPQGGPHAESRQPEPTPLENNAKLRAMPRE